MYLFLSSVYLEGYSLGILRELVIFRALEGSSITCPGGSPSLSIPAATAALANARKIIKHIQKMKENTIRDDLTTPSVGGGLRPPLPEWTLSA